MNILEVGEETVGAPGTFRSQMTQNLGEREHFWLFQLVNRFTVPPKSMLVLSSFSHSTRRQVLVLTSGGFRTAETKAILNEAGHGCWKRGKGHQESTRGTKFADAMLEYI